MPKEKKYKEIIWHGRGGQGGITASQIVAEAAYLGGYKGVTTAPSFGAERRGAPVIAFLKLSQEPIRAFSQIDDPDVVVVLDNTLIPILGLNDKLKKETILIINGTTTPEEMGLIGFQKVAVADVTTIALENNLTVSGVAVLNTPILGAFIKATQLVSMENIKTIIFSRFSGSKGELNYHVACLTFEKTKIYEKK